MKAVVIDDEQSVINTISHIIQEDHSDITICCTAKNIEEGIKAMYEFQPNILFLDINLPDGTGFNLLKELQDFNFKLIFITGHEEYAVQAFKFSALDFILKPIDTNDLNNAINKAKQSIIHEEENLKIRTLLENVENRKTLKRIILRTSEYLHLVEIHDIIRCEADNNYTFFHLSDGKKILVSKTIKEFSKMLDNNGFIRVHQSHLLNAMYIDKYVKTDGGYIIMKDNTNIPVSPNNKQHILKRLEQLSYN